MIPERRAGRIYLDDYEKVTVEDLRRMVGGRPRFRKTDAITVHLADGRDVYVRLVRAPANLGGGDVVYIACPEPECTRKVRLLRIVPDSPGLLCNNCMRRKYGAAYFSQQRPLVGEEGNPFMGR